MKEMWMNYGCLSAGESLATAKTCALIGSKAQAGNQVAYPRPLCYVS